MWQHSSYVMYIVVGWWLSGARHRYNEWHRTRQVQPVVSKLETRGTSFNTLGPRQNGRHFADDIFKCIFVNENVWIPIKISLKFVPKGPINNMPALVQIMAWGRAGDKPLSEPMMVSLPTHICITRPQWVNTKYAAIQSFYSMVNFFKDKSY